MQAKRLALSVVASALLTTGAAAQQLVVPKGPLPLRDVPPGGFFQGKGVTTGSAQPTDKFIVLETRSIPTLGGKENWWRLRSATGSGKEGWAFAGPSDSNFKPAQ
jgi:hypothetical protein